MEAFYKSRDGHLCLFTDNDFSKIVSKVIKTLPKSDKSGYLPVETVKALIWEISKTFIPREVNPEWEKLGPERDIHFIFNEVNLPEQLILDKAVVGTNPP